MVQADEYESFAESYDYIFPQWRQWLDVLSDRIDSFFKPEGSCRILDCACGTGVPAIGLALRGYDVTACDLSPQMVRKARENAADYGATLAFGEIDMTDLSARFGPRTFDAVVCAGNSISHLPAEDMRLKALRSISAVLRDGGLLYLDARDWDVTLAEKKRFHLRACRQCGSRHVTVLDVWDYRDDTIVFNVAVAWQEGEDSQLRVFPLTCYPFSKNAMSRLLRGAGFEVCNVVSETERRFVAWYARKSIPPVTRARG